MLVCRSPFSACVKQKHCVILPSAHLFIRMQHQSAAAHSRERRMMKPELKIAASQDPPLMAL